MRAEQLARQQFVRFPPRWHHVLVPVGPRGATALGTTLYTASRPLPLLAQRALWALARTGGGRLLPGPRTTWQLPMDADVWERLWQEWTALVGPIGGLAVYSRPQASRTGLVLALWRPAGASVVRLRTASGDLDVEARVAAAAAARPPGSFAVPALVGRGSAGGWHWLASPAMSSRPHSPVLALPAGLLHDVGQTVAAALPPPPGVPPHWLPAHGDLTPWNLRRAGGRTWLIDWEDAGWAPPYADEVYFGVTAEATGAPRRAGRSEVGVDPRTRPGSDQAREEAVRYWLDRVQARSGLDADAALTARLAHLLRSRL